MALKYIKKHKDVIDAEVFASWNDLDNDKA